ncbi:putative ankyrin repeat protein [Trypanosoma grayi]|uniref:putative ankyrin repeat protein n=1 Tax=Trypanosoma grayi TaxID=71804 RepID=UPI0004F3F957|nr:putative ankyrin repeat protein [Trypanosoma grayi]KEG13656.1 putative ankyrin repeat protein [Trypanosoma grayi]
MSSVLEGLHSAVVNGDIALLEKLLTPQNVNYVDTDRRMTLLMWAVCLQKHNIAELLLNRGASLYPRDMFYFNVLHYAAWCADAKMMEILLFHSVGYVGVRAETGKLAPSRTAGPSFRPGVKALVDLPHSYSGRTPLMFAAMRGDTSMADFLFSKAGADIRLKDSDGNTAMDLAAYFGHKAVITLFLSKADDETDQLLEVTRRGAEDNCEKAQTVRQLEIRKDLNILLCRDWLPQSLVALS